jgi:hypothetical protein
MEQDRRLVGAGLGERGQTIPPGGLQALELLGGVVVLGGEISGGVLVGEGQPNLGIGGIGPQL